MSIYLPIAEMPVNILLILMLGGITGLLSGIFGVGGGFLMTPFLMFLGVPPAVAVSSSANQIMASSFSGFLAHLRRANVDIKMGIFIIIGGIAGSSFGVFLFALLKKLGQIDLAISLSYVTFLGTIGTLMFIESFRAISHQKKGKPLPKKSKEIWLKRIALPWVVHFPKSNLTISVLLPIGVGFFTGILVSIMGIGGGFVMIPAMIYLLGMPTNVVIGTSLFQIIFVTMNVTFLQAVNTQTVDIVLAFLMIVSSVIGAQFGTRIGLRISAEYLRAMLAVMVLAVVLKLAISLFLTPENPYSLTLLAG